MNNIFGAVSQQQYHAWRDWADANGGDNYLAEGAWFGNPQIKAAVLEKLRVHRAQDEFIQGSYQARTWAGAPAALPTYRGCALGCMVPIRVTTIKEDAEIPFYLLNAFDDEMEYNEEVEMRFGIDRDVAALIDATFELQPDFRAAGDFAVASVEAIPVGADLLGVYDSLEWARQVRRDSSPEQVGLYTERVLAALHNAPMVVAPYLVEAR